MILRIVYGLMACVILALVIKNLSLSDRVEELKKSEGYWFNEYLQLKKENDENKEIIERIKENLPF